MKLLLHLMYKNLFSVLKIPLGYEHYLDTPTEAINTLLINTFNTRPYCRNVTSV